ncbi:hypothetical protein [Candidatus Magnetominusculus xianensis]|uniref:Uncharacterized protein n=1 Tax=Candidatus Magnetominusculus xianensis TaxID=1748249 RepID=A0ABR5SCE8_9BACT|nr:hypothetical protein [Candidatus Magnetominusculus xianensis]KWT81133.1 hypothetical protein ASN18_2639 [Candidatus Magnetominusculus xianensis]MBF0402963.1 hypothetical protein [Nitrospirota bacterium]
MSNTLELTFSNERGAQFKLELDADKNDNVSSFTPGDTCTIRIYPGGQNPACDAMRGTVTVTETSISEEIAEEIEFIDSDTGSLSHEIYEDITTEWTGFDDVTAKVSDDAITLSKKATGVLKATYTVYYDLIEVECSEEGKNIVRAYNDERFGALSVEFETGERKVTFVFKDACTRTVLKGVKLKTDDTERGYTNNKGQLTFTDTVGSHTLYATLNDYKATDKDSIMNSKYSVPKSDKKKVLS